MTTGRNSIKVPTLLCLLAPNVLCWVWVVLIYCFGRVSWFIKTFEVWTVALPVLAFVAGILLLISSVIQHSQRSNSYALITGAFLTVVPLIPAVFWFFSAVFYLFFLIGTLLYVFFAGFNIEDLPLHNFLKNRLLRNSVLSLAICASAALWALSCSVVIHPGFAHVSYFLLYLVLVIVIAERPDYWTPVR